MGKDNSWMSFINKNNQSTTKKGDKKASVNTKGKTATPKQMNRRTQ